MVVSKRVQAVGVVVFLLAIVAVVAVLLTRLDRTSPTSNSQGSNAPTGGAADDIESAAQDPVGPVSIATGTGDLVLRVTAGSCTKAGGPKLELSDNQGRNFGSIRIPQVDDGSGVDATSPAVNAIVFAAATSPLEISVAGADENCTVRRYTTTDAGATWTQETGSVEQWYVDPGSGAVVSPNGDGDAGCKDVVSLAPTSKKNAKVFCADGTVRATTDGGAQWIDAGELDDVSAAMFTGRLTGYAAVIETDCRSRIYVTANGGRSWLPRGCVEPEAAIAGLSGDDKRLVAGGAGGIRQSKNGGSTWKQPPKETPEKTQ